MAGPVVYVVQEQPNFDLSSAEVWGRLEILLPPGNLNFQGPHIKRMLEAKLEIFQPTDWLLLTGSPVAVAMTAVIAYERLPLGMRGKRLQVLKWQSAQKKYLPLRLEL